MFKANLYAGLAAVAGFLQYTGGVVLDILIAVLKAVFGFVGRLLAKIFSFIWKWLTKEFKQPVYDIWCYILTPIAHAFGTLAHAKIQLKKTRELGFSHAIKVLWGAFEKFFIGLIKFLRHTFNYIAPAVCIAFLFALIKYAGTLQYAISVEYNGSDLGVINNAADYDQAQALVQDKITYAEGDEAVIETPKFSVKMLQHDDSPVDTNNLSELMISSSEVGVVEAYGFYINDSLIGVYNEEEMERVRATLEARLAQFYSPNDVSAQFSDKVEINQGRYLENNLAAADGAIAYINGTKTVEAFYIVRRGDSISSIAKELGYSAEQLKVENPFLYNGINTGDMITYSYEEPNLSVITTHYEKYDRVIERKVQYINDNDEEKYTEILVQRGSAGSENVTAYVTEVNGKETQRDIVSRYTIEEMVPMIIRTGTKPNESLEGNTKVIDTLGTFIWPVGWDGGYSYVSSLYGYRSWDHSTHRALDIAAKRGTEIYASNDGVVSFAGTNGAYGKMVSIDHGKRYETWYAHMSVIVAEKGDVVKKGDVIGYVGMTGSASGNHLHFELRHHDDRMNPIYALGGIGDHEVRNY